MGRRRQYLREEPLKWRKYELLALFGLAKMEALRSAIRRFPRARSDVFLADLRKAVRVAYKGDSVGNDVFFVVKYVPKNLSMMLPNTRVYGPEDLPRVERIIRRPPFDYDELWYCKTYVGTAELSLAGRLVVDSESGTQTIEQVWRCSPRLIESVGPAFPFPFVRATRPSWGWSPRMDHIHLPMSAQETKTVIYKHLAVALLMIDGMRDKLEVFIDAVAPFGIVVAIEYKIERNRIQIIDWDSGNDARVLTKWLRDDEY